MNYLYFFDDSLYFSNSRRIQKLIYFSESLKNRLQNAEQENQDLEAEISSANVKNVKLSHENTQLSDQNAQLSNHNAQLLNHNVRIKNQIKDLENNFYEVSEVKAKNEKLTRKLFIARQKSDNDFQAVSSKVARLETQVSTLKMQHANDIKIIEENIEALSTMSDKIKMKNAEMSTVKLSEERCLLEMNKLRKETSFHAEYFCLLKKTLEIILQKDAKFCQNDEDNKEILDDIDVFDMINSMLHEVTDSKQRSSQDIYLCISKLQVLQDKKSGYKKNALKFSIEVDELKNTLRQKDRNVNHLEKKILVLKKHIEMKEKKDEINTKFIKNLNQQIAEKDGKIKKMHSDQNNLKQRESQMNDINSAEQTIIPLEQLLKDKERILEKLETNPQHSLKTDLTLEETGTEELKSKNAVLIQQYREVDTKIKRLNEQKFNQDTAIERQLMELTHKDTHKLIELLQSLTFSMEKRIQTEKDKVAQEKNKMIKMELDMKEKETDFVGKMKFYSSSLTETREKVN